MSVRKIDMSGARFAAAAAITGCLAVGACGTDPDTAKRKYERSGDRYAAQAQYQEAVIEYRNALKQDPLFSDVRVKLAAVYERLGDASNALGEYQRAADLLPGSADIQVKAANVLLLAGQFEAAKSRADKALALGQDNVEAQIASGNALAGLKDLDGAIGEIERAIGEQPDRSATYASLGALELARGNGVQAEAAFKKATNTDPQSLRARLALGNFYWGTGRLAEAESELKMALAISSKDILANRAMAVFYLATSRAATAEPYLKTVVDRSSQSSDRSVLALLLADYYVSAGRYGEATTLLQALATTDPAGFAAATIRLSAIAARVGDSVGAARLIDSVLDKDPRHVDALVGRVNVLLADRKNDEALAHATRAVQAGPRAASAYDALARVHAAREEWDDAITAYGDVLRLDPRVNDARVELARLSLMRGRIDDAIQFAQAALKVRPGLADATTILVRAMLRKGDIQSAEPHVTRLAKAFPDSAGAQADLGQLYALKGGSARARNAFERAVALDPANIEALTGLTALDLQARTPVAARARLEARLAVTRKDPHLLLLAARLDMALGDMNATERHLREAIDIDPTQLDAYALLGQFYASQQRLDEARVEFEKMAQGRNPKSAVGAQTVVGMIFEMQNRRGDAQASYEKVLLMDPRAAVASNNLAWLYAESGSNLDRALELAQSAKSQLADSPEVSDTLGWVYYKKGMLSLALQSLRTTVDRSPKNALYQYHLGLAYSQAGNPEGARKALEQALLLNPRFDGSDNAKRLLASLKG
jgi:tetratricopeptide (TPR) repeat protein